MGLRWRVTCTTPCVRALLLVLAACAGDLAELRAQHERALTLATRDDDEPLHQSARYSGSFSRHSAAAPGPNRTSCKTSSMQLRVVTPRSVSTLR